MRPISIVLLAMVLSGCNLSDPIEQLPGAGSNNNTINNNQPDMPEPDSGNDMGGGGDGELMADLLSATVNGNSFPTELPARGAPFTFEAELVATNSATCLDCKVQLVVGLADGTSVECLYDGPATGMPVAVSGDLQSAEEPGVQQVLWDVVEHSDCEDALGVIAARPDPPPNSAGAIDFTAAGPLLVIATTPESGASDVVVSSLIRVGFDEDIDSGSATGRVTLTGPMGQVPVAMTVSGSEILLDPVDDLEELQTAYTLVVSAGITGGGRTLEDDLTVTFVTRMFAPDVWYSIHNESQTAAYSLAVAADFGAECQMKSQDDTTLGQRFRFVPSANGWVAYNEAFPGRALDGRDGVSPCSMAPLDAGGALPGQIWRFVPTGTDGFYAQTQQLGDVRSLDNGTGQMEAARPVMQLTTAVNRQFWRFRRLP